VRALHASRLGRVTALLPLGAVIEPVRGLFERLRGPRGSSADVGELHPMQRAEELDEAFRQLHAVDPAAVEGASRASSARLNLRGWIEAGLQRLQSSDVALGVHAAASSGGGRVASIAALIGVCVSGVGAGTYCVATALLPDPKPAIRAEAKPSAKRKSAAAERAAKRVPSPASRAVTPTPTPAPTRAPRRVRTKHVAASHTQAPISPAQAGTQDFSFEQSAAPGPVTPAAAPSTGGSEFEP
jgi:hypothetical protein